MNNKDWKYDPKNVGIDALTLRDWFAGIAMGGLLRAEHEHNEQGVAGFAEIAQQSYAIADAMLKFSTEKQP